MVSVAGKPVLGHLLDMIANAGLPVQEYIFITGYLGDQVEKYVREEYKPNAPAYFAEQKELIGQSHAIWLAREHLMDGSPLFVMFVDTLFTTNLQGMDEPEADALIFCKQVEDPRPFGVVSLDGQGYITGFVEKPATLDNRNAVIGLYYFRQGKALIEAIEEQMARKLMLKGEYFIADAMKIMIENGKKFRTRAVADWLDAGNPTTVLETNRWLLNTGHDNSATLAAMPGVAIVPPVYIAPGVQIKNSVIGPHVSLGANCKVEGSILRDTVVDADSTITDSTLEASLIGRKATVSGRYTAMNIVDSSYVVVK
jgi:glucose-1-phosphate thymidylyltransferase